VLQKLVAKAPSFARSFANLGNGVAFRYQNSLKHHLLSRFSARLLPNADNLLADGEPDARDGGGCVIKALESLASTSLSVSFADGPVQLPSVATQQEYLLASLYP
jgi:hypothetical protein